MKKIITLSALILFLTAAGAFACEFTYILKGPDGSGSRITPSGKVTLEAGSKYTLSVSYREDHKNCIVPPQDTMFLVEDERWKSGKDYLPLQLLSAESWVSDGRSHSTSFTFTAVKQGDWPLEILRECTRGGYKASIMFRVV